ncbi:IclR family transcriptional regulator [Gemmobacter sp.]|uniref:IclR family transcriptional regulator n=1 Tax=Gemmobacter sp. TaxID=1898957 RepID=UPI002AFF8AAE|nr:IclR family transcriptional regulator [Gemmobacter sp.]
MSGILDRTLALLELLARHPAGLPLAGIAQALNIPASGAHRLLTDLVRHGYVRQLRDQGDYALTIRLAGLGLAFLARAGISDLAQPVLDDLAAASGELVRLSVADGGRLVWVAVAQGATAGLRYDPGREQGAEVSLAYSASGLAWLSALTEDAALHAVAQQGLAPPDGAAGPTLTIAQVAGLRAGAVAQGHARAVDSFLAGMAAIAVPLRSPEGAPLGCLSIAGPAVRLTGARMDALVPVLAQAAHRLAEVAAGSAFFRGRA